MSDYHILNQNEDKNNVRVAFHFTVPVETNEASINLSAALQSYKPFTESAVPNLATDFAAENADLVAGLKYECIANVTFPNANETVANKRQIIRDKWTALSTKVQEELRRQLQWWGYNEDVP